MSAITVTRFDVDPANVAELRVRHTALVTAVKQADRGLLNAWLGRIDDTHWVGVWFWSSAESLRAVRENQPAPELARAAFALVENPAVEEIEVFDEF